MGTDVDVGTSEPAIRVSVLGPLDIEVVGHGPVHLAPRPGMVLTSLVLGLGDIVSVDRLIDVLWSDDAPAQARNSIQAHIAAVRRGLGDEGRAAIESHRSGYRIRTDLTWVDLIEFERLCEDASRRSDPARRIVLLTEALELWRGDPVQDLTSAGFTHPRLAEIFERRLVATEQLAAAELAVGRQAAALGRLESIAGQHPYRERVAQLRARAFYASGQQTEALRVLQRLRTDLRDEVGVLPGPDIDALEHAILDHDSSLTGAPSDDPPSTSLPSGTVSFLFTDIEQSTERWDDDAAAMDRALSAHDAALHEAITAHDGTVFKHTGDGVCAVFASAQNAVDAAVAAQRVLQLPVRMGVHTGEAAERDGDYFGPPLNRTARIADAGHGGQILLSSTTADLVDRISMVDLGVHRLKGLRDDQHLWQVRADGLASRFPPVRSVPAIRHNLPLRLDRLVGRDVETEDIAELVRHHRLVTVVGPGGVGKTRIGVRVAEGFVDDRADGVWFVDLTTADPDVESVAAAVGWSVGFDARQGQGWLTTVVDALRTRDALLVMDNCEHVLGAASAVVRAVCDTSARVSVIATSRERLGLRGEQIWPLRPLDAGAELFTERASQIDPTLDLESCAEAIETICTRLDGLPLAIELAAGRVGSLHPEEIAARLDQRFRLLRTTDRDSEDRHRTLAAAIEWSYQQLGSTSAALFRRLGLFVGTFDLAAAAAVAGRHLDELDVADALDDLVGKSLVTTSRLRNGTRYRLLDSLAAFAKQALAAGDEAELAHTEHASARVELTVQRYRSLLEGSAEPVLPVLLADLDDIDAVYRWACDHDVSLAERLWEPVMVLVANRALPSARMLGWAQEMERLHRRSECSAQSALLAAGVMLLTGVSTRGEALTQEILALDGIDPATRALALGQASWCAFLHRNDAEVGLTLAEQAVQLLDPADGDCVAAMTRAHAVVSWTFAGDFDRALEVLEAHVPPPHGSGEMAILGHFISAYAFRKADLERSTAHLTSALELCERQGDAHGGRSFFRYQLALNELAAGRDANAATEFAAVLPGLLDLGDPMVLGLAMEDLAAALARTGRPAEAVTMFAVAASTRTALNALAYDSYVRRRKRLVPQLRRQLGEAGHEDSWNTGAAMTVDEAVALASTAFTA